MADTNRNEISVVIGSWGSYSACNERALGSSWLTLNDYKDWDDILEELKKQGFELDGIDQELFIQDTDGLPGGQSVESEDPKHFFECLRDSGVLDENYKFDVLDAYLEVRDIDDFMCLVDNYGYDWDIDITLYRGYDWEDLGREMLCDYNIPEFLEDYIDYEAYGESYKYDGYEEFSGGIINLRY